MEKIIYWIWLSNLNLRPIEKIKLLDIFKEPEKLYKLSKKELKNFTDSKELIAKITDENKKRNLEKIVGEAEKTNTKIITFRSEIYSNELKRIYDYPIILYAKGNLKLLNQKSIAIVGCRNCSDYGRKMSQRFSYLLAKRNICIVSGMAKGIDAYAHIGAIEAKGSTIAVLGSGTNYIYPAENKEIYNKIINNSGLIVSEYGINTSPTAISFPIRNRIISGLSEKVLIVEAMQRSGSIITANLAAEQGKVVYAIPGNITNNQSNGTNNLIKDGAILVSSLEYIIDL